jgi:hypothetical protein
MLQFIYYKYKNNEDNNWNGSIILNRIEELYTWWRF